jgi:hypothetical protein
MRRIALLSFHMLLELFWYVVLTLQIFTLSVCRFFVDTAGRGGR